jgi:hypothetical protein
VIARGTFGPVRALAVFAQPSIQIGPRGVEIDPGGRSEPREERIVREEGGCRITIIRRTESGLNDRPCPAAACCITRRPPNLQPRWTRASVPETHALSQII